MSLSGHGPETPVTLKVAVNSDSMATWFPEAAADFARNSGFMLEFIREDEAHKHLDAALALAHAIQQVQPHHAKRNNNEPARTAQPGGMFKAPSPVPPGPKLDRRKLGNQRLKRGPRLSNDELVARGLGEYVRQHTG